MSTLDEVTGHPVTVPPQPSVLLNPGPVNVHPRVREALAYPDICHREPEVAALMRDVRSKVTSLCGSTTETHSSVLLTGSGTAALEAAFSSIVPREGRILILDNGNYGERLWRIVDVHGIDHVRLEFGWNNPIDLELVEQTLAADPGITHIGMVQHETSTGMINPVRGVGEIAEGLGRSVAVDAISSLGCEQFDMMVDHVDWCIGTANKCLEGLPGISFVCARRGALEALADVPARTLYLDLYGHYVAQEQNDSPLFTPAVQVLYAFDQALDLALEEGVDGRIARYQSLAARLREGIRALDLEFLLPEEHWSNSVTNVHVPEGVSYADLHDELRERGFTIYGVQAQLGEVFRIANMGQVDAQSIEDFLVALGDVLGSLARGEAVA